MSETATNAKTAKTAKTLVRCACAEFEIGNTVELPDGTPDWEGVGTGCTQTTRRVFAPGSDAKLKSLLIKAGIQGLEVRQGSITTDAVTAAKQFGFAPMVAAGIERGIAKAAAKAAKAAAPKPSRKPAKKDKAAAAERAAALTEKMAQVAGKVVVVTEAAPVAEPIVEVVESAEAAGDTVQIKLGRWTYAAIIIDGDAHYTDGKNQERVALEGNYKRV